MNVVSPIQASDLVADGALLLDVRTPAEFRSVHANGANLLPLDQVQGGALPAIKGDEQAIVVLCKSGKRAEMAAVILEQGLKNPVHVVEGGTDGWVAADLDHEKGQGVISLERQVRIAAGSLIVLGVLLSVLVNPHAIWLSGFVGAGLVFAGVTDTCGMALCLAKMPWNQSRS